MNICVFGLWHLGLVTSACLAKLGHTVVGLDFNKKIVKGLQNKKTPLFEPGLNELILESMQTGKLSFTYEAKEALKKAKVLWFAFDTPIDDKDAADILFLENNFRKIMPYFNNGLKIVISSQAPVGFVNKIENLFVEYHPNKKCHFACSPENLKLGKALDAFLNPDRIIIGVRNQESKEAFIPLFSSITARLQWMKVESAEMTKHAINSFLATSVCFANEISYICEQVGADAKEVELGLKTESRIGPKAYLRPGAAFSGGTLARDINFLIRLSSKFKLPSYLIKAVKHSNLFHRNWIEVKCRQALGSLKKKTVAILGLTYKPGTDTLRRSPAVELAKLLQAKGALVNSFDPVIKSIPKDLSKIICLKNSAGKAILNADVVIIATECPEFLQFGEDVINLMKNKIIIDPNGFIVKLIEHKDLSYISVGKSFDKESVE
ncbi:MAG: nucleotide sugar dehydrogenase [Candidatus Omnitrophota bacterium]|nr:nucleotide sugar dehydrogenase [Candidatus Omnitrophota bacterium]